MVGENFKVKTEVTKLCEQKRTVSKLIVEVYTKRYTGDIVSHVTSHTYTDIALDGKKGESKWSRMMVCHDIKEAW